MAKSGAAAVRAAAHRGPRERVRRARGGLQDERREVLGGDGCWVGAVTPAERGGRLVDLEGRVASHGVIEYLLEELLREAI
jgi:hypothetical protein